MECISSLYSRRARGRIKRKTVITGFNTDVEHDGITYHVQTEDKGLDTPLILSLVYTRGEILASKRVRYDDLISEGFDEKVLTERLLRQHKLICAAIRAGRLDDLKKMSEQDAATRTAKKKESVPVVSPPPPIETTLRVEPDAGIPSEVTKSSRPLPPLREHRLPPPSQRPAQPVLPVVTPEPVADPVRVRTATADSLRLALVDEKNYRGGERLTLRVRVEDGADSRQSIAGAEVIVKVLGSTFRPMIFQALTGNDGIASFNTELPHFRSGRAAILVRVTAGRLDAELRRIIQQG